MPLSHPEKEIILPSNTLSVDTTGPDQRVDVVQRGSRLYDRKRHTFQFERPLRVDLVTLLPFDDLPQAAREYIVIRAGRVFQDRVVGSEQLNSFTIADERQSWAALHAAECRSADYSFRKNVMFSHTFIAGEAAYGGNLFSHSQPHQRGQSAAVRFAARLASGNAGERAVVGGRRSLEKAQYPPHVACLSPTPFRGAYVHTINRDASEKYVVILTNGNLRVFDFQGREKTVNCPSGSSYLSAENPEKAFNMVTVADHTFIVNKTIRTAVDSATTAPQRPHEGLVWVRQRIIQSHLYGSSERQKHFRRRLWTEAKRPTPLPFKPMSLPPV